MIQGPVNKSAAARPLSRIAKAVQEKYEAYRKRVETR